MLTLSCPIGTFLDFTLSNARRFYSSMGNPLDRKGLPTSLSKMSPFLTLSCPIGTFVDFTLSNARQILLVNGEPLGQERVKKRQQKKQLNTMEQIHIFCTIVSLLWERRGERGCVVGGVNSKLQMSKR